MVASMWSALRRWLGWRQPAAPDAISYGQAVQQKEIDEARQRLLDTEAAREGRWYDDPTAAWPVVTPGQRMLYRLPRRP